MPYIKQELRSGLQAGLDAPECAGEMNFLMTVIAKEFLGEDPRYEDFNSVIGALECCKLELYRRMVAPYEDKKIVENGDVY